MRYAETGYNLEIDLSTGNIERVETDPRVTEHHLGGLGSNAKVMWDRVGPEVEPFSPDNLLIFGAGLLCGTFATGANRTVVTTVSPQTRFMGFSMMGGFFGPELKYAGYDKVIIRGQSPKLVYLWIKDDQVEIRDAAHLRGKGAVETQDLIREELKEPQAHVAAIGMAGENRVYFASIEQGKSSASRLGLGAVMGDKGLKAIAVRGTKDINIARPADLWKQINEVMAYAKVRGKNLQPYQPLHNAGLGAPQEMRYHDEKWHTESFHWGNARTRRKDFWTPEVDERWKRIQDSVRTRLVSCYNCSNACGGLVSVPGLPKYFMKCFSKITYTMAAYSDLEFGFIIGQRATEYGVDGYSTPLVIAFALELLEVGILTDKDFPGMPSDSEGRFFYLLDRIVRREGIGDVLANGTYWAAKQIGNGAEEYAHCNIKKHEQAPAKLGMLNPIYFLMMSTGEKANITQIQGQYPQSPFPTMEERLEFAKDWTQVPDQRFIEWFLKWEPRGEFSFPYYPGIQECCELVDWMERMHYIDDSAGICTGMSAWNLKPPYHMHNYPSIISAATGFPLDEEGLTKIARRNRTLIRAFNARRGMRREDDKVPENSWKKRFPELEKELLDAYYKFRGFNLEGVPTKEYLQEIDLGYVGEDLEQRGIYNEPV